MWCEHMWYSACLFKVKLDSVPAPQDILPSLPRVHHIPFLEWVRAGRILQPSGVSFCYTWWVVLLIVPLVPQFGVLLFSGTGSYILGEVSVIILICHCIVLCGSRVML
uniref:Uncharacterized protein n=1 Tax=Cacopsylla melanoneura TaxID=428564 RepID=A0A8D8ZLM6_9HEMI